MSYDIGKLKKVVKIKRNAEIYLNVGEKKREEGKFNEAVYYFYLAYKNGNAETSVRALVEMGNAYCDMEKYHEAVGYYIRALDKVPLSIEISNYISRAYSNLGEEDLSFFYFTPGMTLDRYYHILKESEMFDRYDDAPLVRVIERGDEMTLNIAVKLFESGDSKYAAQLLDAVKPESNQFITASNMLTLYEIEQGNYEKAKKHLDLAILKKDNVLARCSQLLLLSKVNEKGLDGNCFDDLKQLGTEGVIRKIESFSLTLIEQKSVALAYIRANEPECAIKHLSILLDSGEYDKDVMICYALCLHECGMPEARRAIFNAHYTYPEDAFINYFLDKIIKGERNLGLGPRMKIEAEKAYLEEIDKKLDIIYKGKKAFAKDADFKQKLEWLYQAGYVTANNKASLILAHEKNYDSFLRGLLLRDLDMQTKKVILFSLLLNGREAKFIQKSIEYNSPDNDSIFETFDFGFDEEYYDESGLTDFIIEDGEVEEQEKSNIIRGIRFSKLVRSEAKEFYKARKKKLDPDKERDFSAYVYKGRLGIVIDSFYTRLRIVYPKNMDLLFHTSYCAAFSSFVFCDSCFEDRLLGAALRALKRYNSPEFDKTQIKSEEALAAALFFAAHHSEISTIRQCSQLFGCPQQLVSDYLKLLSLRQTRRKPDQKGEK